MRSSLSKEEIFSRFYSKHDSDCYELCLDDYLYNKSVVEVECNIHGYTRKELNYLMEIPCPLCKNEKDLHRKLGKFLTSTKERFGDRFSYNKVVYKGVDEPVLLSCKTHSEEFLISPYNHLNSISGGCKICANNYRKSIRKYTNKTLINKFKDVHGDKYTYDKVQYKGIYDKVSVGCTIHGNFNITPDSHLQGGGCYLCGRISSSEKHKYTYTELVERIYREGGDYIVCLDGYENQKSVMKSLCPIHGTFNNKVSSMLLGQGCPSCSSRNVARSSGYCPKSSLYLIDIENGFQSFIKVGCSSDVNKRVRDIKSALSKNYKVHLIRFYDDFEDYSAYIVESLVLKFFEHSRGLFPIHFSGHTECLQDVDLEELENFISSCRKKMRKTCRKGLSITKR